MPRILLLFLALVAAVSARDLRIGVFGLFHPSELVLKATPHSSLLINCAGTEWKLACPRTVRFRATRNGIVCTAGDRTSNATLVRISDSTEFILSIPGKIERRFVGSLEIRTRPGELIPILITDLETAVASVVAAESTHPAPIEALKAQAIAARSFYVASTARHPGFEFCDTTHCQFLREPPQGSDAARAATLATKGLVLFHDGTPLPALFSSSCGGRTRTLAEAGMPADGYPYYAIDCRPCRDAATEWQRSFPAHYAAFLEDRSETHRIELGRILGWNALPGPNYATTRDGDTILVHGRGEGHGIGLCQRGATAMAASGAGHRLILSYYYPNTTLGPPE